MLSVSDNGSGMSSETKKQIFEPFFTTKEIGKGTGLGLATVYGIVKQSGGNIEVQSEKGVGTTFRIYLPELWNKWKRELQRYVRCIVEGSEAILLVEDEEIVRNLTRRILEDCGYSVIEAQNGIEALEISDKDS
jgi:hypothetical protein